jgi:UDP-glucuronate 4-epimerase
VLVTGVAGFIGSHTAERLLRSGVDVAGVDNFDGMYDARLKRANVAELVQCASKGGSGKLHMLEADLNDGPALTRFMDETRPTGVIHLAARAGVRPSIQDPVGYCTANVTATAALLVQASRVGCERFVMASSSSVYGNSDQAPFSEEMDVSRPISPYAATKKACELIGHTHWHLTRLPVGCLRFFTVYGPRQRPDLAIQMFMTKVAKGESLTLFGQGTRRDYTYIEDIVDGILASYERIPTHGYRVWNLGSDHPVGLDDMVETICSAVGRRVEITRRDMQAGDVVQTWADLRRASAELGYRPRTSFEDGVRLQWEWNRGRMADR